MAETVVLVAQERKAYGTHIARRLRRAGQVPGVVYGHGEGTAAISVSSDELAKAIRHGSRIVELKQGDKGQTALVKDLQWDPLGHDILHVDFARVSADERVELAVRIELRGIAPGATAGGVLTHQLHELNVECLATAIPDSIRVNIGTLQIGSVVHVRDLTLPPGVVAKDDAEAVVVQVAAPAAEAEAGALPGEMAEPEVIGKVKEEGEGEE